MNLQLVKWIKAVISNIWTQKIVSGAEQFTFISEKSASLALYSI